MSETHTSLVQVMELVEGGELFDHIVQMGSFTEPVARYVFIQIAEGLKYIHSQDRNNSRRGLLEIKLSDFGHSKLINDGYSTALTRATWIAQGMPQQSCWNPWNPPDERTACEVSDPLKAAQGYNQRVDLWSLGVAPLAASKYPQVDQPTRDEPK
eukprot:Skav229135  [mRNA]  locus=scaffold1875:65290:66929:+ [translate_table: standard]